MKELPTQEQINAQIEKGKIEKLINKFASKNSKAMEKIWKELAEIWLAHTFNFDTMSVKVIIKLY